MSAHRAFTRNIRRPGVHINTAGCVGIRALTDSRSATDPNRGHLVDSPQGFPHIHSYPQVIVHNALCASSSTKHFAAWAVSSPQLLVRRRIVDS